MGFSDRAHTHPEGEALDLKELKEILQILEEKEITEFELEEEGMKLRIRKGPTPSGNHASAPATVAPLVPAVLPGVPSLAAVPAAAAPEPGPRPAPVEEEPSDVTVVKSPIVGTFYRTPDPNAPPFVDVGDRVRVGQVLCIIEAMKLMNEIEAEVAGEVVKVHRESGQPVQYGDALFTIRQD
jgi:acetyl-CoA carboxylase biotin carboxyl carrier protein